MKFFADNSDYRLNRRASLIAMASAVTATSAAAGVPATRETVTPPVSRMCQLGLHWGPDSDNVIGSFDAQHWAAAFLDTLRKNPDIIIDHELMHVWFANALMRGYDEHAGMQQRKRPRPTIEELEKILSEPDKEIVVLGNGEVRAAIPPIKTGA